MIITRSPLRITLGGGGTDLPSYYKEHGGFLISGAIDKYVYITVHRTFVDYLILKYSSLEHVTAVDEIQHPIVREAFKMLEIAPRYLEITSMADIPSGTGLGSSGSFTTALLKALYTYQRVLVSPEQLAQRAAHIEIERLGEPVGKQDQYIASYGGLTCFTFLPDERVVVEPLAIDAQTLYTLEDNLLLFFTGGYTRSASQVLHDQDKRSKAGDVDMIRNLDFIKDLGMQSKAALEQGNLHDFARLMDVHWEYKKRQSQQISNSNIDDWYKLAKQHGALGGKLIGAGGGGFLMFYTEDNSALRHAMAQAGLTEVRFRFDFEGTKGVI